MTSDAKLGLLLGLVLIIAIVFAVNGIPRFASATDNGQVPSEDTVIRIPTEDIMSKARQTVKILEKHTQRKMDRVVRPQPNNIIASDSKVVSLPMLLKNKEYDKYTVQANENLAVIAKKFYGPEEGNRIVNIKKIAAYNDLKSVDCIYQGQKLKIPVLKFESVESLEKTGQFVRVNSYSPAEKDSSVRNTISLPTVSVTRRLRNNTYVVRQDDTLWSIASKMLGSGGRYHEILKANSNISSQDHLSPGMVIKLPEK